MSEIAQIILAQEQRRCTAMCTADLVELNELLDPRLYFSHATGAVDDRAAYLEKMGQGQIVYQSIDWSELLVTVLPGERAAILTGRMVTAVSVNNVDKRLDNRALAVWVEANGFWRLHTFQSTPLPTV